ncbi:HIRAN domain-containing protein [Sphingomonas sp. GC_Shp_3]|uniref:HIRAN domain-containing protein n=1 Tax=Sphingomonas sp. GC_Shp_3 TaxID=2937383 RepID=UPI00226AFC2A
MGAQHPNAHKRAPTRRFAIDLCRPGDPVELRPEPKNPADEYAIAVHNREGMQMGYLTAERAPWIGAHIRSGREIICIFQESTQHGAVIRAAFDGIAPTLPAPRDPPPAAPDFYPDEVYSDD